MPDGEGGSLRLTYAQLAEARGISKASAERLVRNRKWPRLLGNDGVAIVIVPPGESSPGSPPKASPGSGGGKPGGHIRPGRPPRNPPPDHAPDPPPDFRGMIEAALAPILGQLEAANQRADRAERRADEAQAAERKAIELVKHVTAEASELRKRGDALHTQLADAQAAERIARDEAAGLRTRLDQLQTRGLWARLRNKR